MIGDYAIFGEPGLDIDYNTIEQMNQVMALPVSERGALMPDAHLGYAMPIGGVVGLANAVSPSFVGYDIACRMTLSYLDLSQHEANLIQKGLASAMQKVSRFGVGAQFDGSDIRDHAVMHDPLWDELPHLQAQKDRAQNQLGSSGGGNHFFDLVYGNTADDEEFVAIVTHSGSRGVGHSMATHYLKLAAEETRAQYTGIQKGYEWLSLDSEAGKEYWAVMQLMGRYAQANHHLIHDYFANEVGVDILATIENHHNFAWEQDGLIVHRKGATPADVDQVGIIPGSAGTASFVVSGRGEQTSLKSSPHGAGRTLSRTKAKKEFDQAKHDESMEGVLEIGVGHDESPFAYKDIHRVMKLSDDLLNVEAEMYPKIVVMGGKAYD